MTYKWNAAVLGEVFALPSAVADRTLRLAGAAQLKVLVWFAKNGGTFDPAACAAAIGLSPADCTDAMQFWIETGVLTAEGAPAPAAAPAEFVPAVSAPPPSLPSLTMTAKTPETRPQFPDVVARQKSCGDFDYLLKNAEQRLGRALTHGEMETFLYIYDTLGLPAEVILMILVDMVTRDKIRAKSSVRTYLEKVAITWADKGIRTIAAAEEELCRIERRERVRERMKELFALDRTPNLLQVDAMVRWTEEWDFSEDVILVAFERCREKTGGFQSGYMSRILEGWHADGIDSVDAARAALSPKKSSGAKPLLSDEATTPVEADEYERAAASYRPVYKKK